MTMIVETAQPTAESGGLPAVAGKRTADWHRSAGLTFLYRENAGLILILVSFVAASVLVELVTGIPVTARLRRVSLVDVSLRGLETATLASVFSIGAFAGYRLLQLVRSRNHSSSTAPGIAESWSNFSLRPSFRRVANVLICLVGMSLFFAVFVGFKVAIPQLHPFSWDETFMVVDRALHLGHDPWRVLHPLLGSTRITQGLDVLYYFWFPLKLGVVAWFAWVAEGQERQRFFVAYMMTWVLLGNVVAFVFSSAGPCYFDLATGNLGPYEEQMAYLGSVHAQVYLLSADIQAKLLEAYYGRGNGVIEGIAAMPSLHVALPVLFALSTYRASRIVGLFFAAYGIAIFVGSVHLGWHYAVDGYASVGFVLLIWWAVGRLVPSRRERRRAATCLR